MDEWRRTPGGGAYARAERERRFLVRSPPPTAGPVRLIEDRYVLGTRLRLRRVTVDGESVWKLTQKVRVRDDDPSDVRVTNSYLEEAEYLLLATLPAATLRKTRRVCHVGHRRFVVDYFHEQLAGLHLAEIEVEDLQARLPDVPWLGPEVSEDNRYSGGHLAVASPREIQALLAEGGQGR